MKMMVLGVSVTSTPNGSLESFGASTLGAGGGGGGGSDAAGGIDWANAEEATPTAAAPKATSAARVVARQSEIIEISLDPRRPARHAGIAAIYHVRTGTV